MTQLDGVTFTIVAKSGRSILSMKLHFPIFVTPKTLDTYGYVIKGKT